MQATLTSESGPGPRGMMGYKKKQISQANQEEGSTTVGVLFERLNAPQLCRGVPKDPHGKYRFLGLANAEWRNHLQDGKNSMLKGAGLVEDSHAV